MTCDLAPAVFPQLAKGCEPDRSLRIRFEERILQPPPFFPVQMRKAWQRLAAKNLSGARAGHVFSEFTRNLLPEIGEVSGFVA